MVGAGVIAGVLVDSAAGVEIKGMLVDVNGTAGLEGGVAGVEGGRVTGAWPGWPRSFWNWLVVR